MGPQCSYPRANIRCVLFVVTRAPVMPCVCSVLPPPLPGQSSLTGEGLGNKVQGQGHLAQAACTALPPGASPYRDFAQSCPVSVRFVLQTRVSCGRRRAPRTRTRGTARSSSGRWWAASAPSCSSRSPATASIASASACPVSGDSGCGAAVRERGAFWWVGKGAGYGGVGRVVEWTI